MLDLASHFQSGQLSDAKIATMDDETLIAELTKVKGIGMENEHPCQHTMCCARVCLAGLMQAECFTDLTPRTLYCDSSLAACAVYSV